MKGNGHSDVRTQRVEVVGGGIERRFRDLPPHGSQRLWGQAHPKSTQAST